MIEFIRTGDFKHIQLFVVVILAMWMLQVLAVCIDFWSGTNTAKSLGQKLNSNGFRRSFVKLGDYWRVALMFLLIDVIGSLFACYNLPFATMLVTLAVIGIEGRSVWENAKSKKSQAAKLPDTIRDIIKCVTVKEAEELLKRIIEIQNGTDTETKIQDS